jgi:hypothetical protein
MGGLYFGVGGMAQVEYNDRLQALTVKVDSDTTQLEYDGMTWKNETELKKYILHQEQQIFFRVFPWVDEVPDIISLLITSCAFCLLGSIVSIMRRLLFENDRPATTFMLLYPLFGAVSGLLVLAINYLLPTILVRDAENLRPITLMFFSLFVGLFLKEFYMKISSVVNSKFFKHE